MSALWGLARSLPAKIYHVLVRRHLERLFFHGPSIMGVGFWQGKSPTDMCAELTTFASDFWAAHPAECDQIVHQHLRTFLVSVETALYSTLLVIMCLFGVEILFGAGPS